MAISDPRLLMVLLSILVLGPGIIALFIVWLRHIRLAAMAREVTTFYDECHTDSHNIVINAMTPERKKELHASILGLLQYTDAKDPVDPMRTRYVSTDVIEFMKMFSASGWDDVQELHTK